MLSLNQINFSKFIGSKDKTAIVKFYADWCKDCRAIKKSAEELAELNAERFAFGELDTMVAPEIRDAYFVRGIPTFVAFRGGAEVARVPEASSAQKEVKSRQDLEAFLERLSKLS